MKKLFCICLGLLLLTGCSQKAPESTQTTTSVTAPAEEPSPSGTYLLLEQVHYDKDNHISVRMNATYDDQLRPTSVFLDSGADITYTPEYDENGMITGFSVSRLLYGEETLSHVALNEYGDIVQQTTDENTTDVVCSYDSGGRMIKKETSVNGNLSYVKTWSYDCWGNTAQMSNTYANGSYTLIYDNTYENHLLTAIHCKYENGDTEHTERFTYNEAGQLTCWEQVHLEETFSTVYTYNDAGLLAEKKTYVGEVFTGRTTYTWTEAPVELTAAQCNALKQLGLLL